MSPDYFAIISKTSRFVNQSIHSSTISGDPVPNTLVPFTSHKYLMSLTFLCTEAGQRKCYHF